MSGQQSEPLPPDPLQQRVQQLVAEALQQERPYDWFEPLYAQAQGDTTQVPWAKLAPNAYLQNWLNHHAGAALNRSAIVVGCGLGDDAEALSQAGFQVTGFDISPSAIAWCKQRFPASTVNYQVADLFQLDAEWQGQFDVVFECRNIQALPLDYRTRAIAAVASLVSFQGSLLVVTHLREDDREPDGPPWPLSNQELSQFQQLGFREIQRDYLPAASPTIQILGLEYCLGH